MTTGRPSFFNPFRRSRSTPLSLAELDRRFRREAEFVQAPLPAGLARRTLDALQACQRVPTRRIIARSSVLAATLAFSLLVAITGVISVNSNQTPVASNAVAAINAPAADSSTFSLPNPFAALAQFEESRQDDVEFALMTEARLIARDANRAGNALLAALPQRFRRSADPTDTP